MPAARREDGDIDAVNVTAAIQAGARSRRRPATTVTLSVPPRARARSIRLRQIISEDLNGGELLGDFVLGDVLGQPVGAKAA
jgi:hypothetical protein